MKRVPKQLFFPIFLSCILISGCTNALDAGYINKKYRFAYDPPSSWVETHVDLNSLDSKEVVVYFDNGVNKSGITILTSILPQHEDTAKDSEVQKTVAFRAEAVNAVKRWTMSSSVKLLSRSVRMIGEIEGYEFDFVAKVQQGSVYQKVVMVPGNQRCFYIVYRAPHKSYLLGKQAFEDAVDSFQMF